MDTSVLDRLISRLEDTADKLDQRIRDLEKSAITDSAAVENIKNQFNELKADVASLQQDNKEVVETVGKFKTAWAVMFMLGGGLVWVFNHLSVIKKFLLG